MLQTRYYRYYTSGQADGYQHGLHYVFNAQSYSRLTAALGINLSSLTDAQVAPAPSQPDSSGAFSAKTL